MRPPDRSNLGCRQQLSGASRGEAARPFYIRVGAVAAATGNRRIAGLDGNGSLDVTGTYGVNVFGFEFYEACIDRGAERARELLPVLDLCHPVVADNVRRLKELSGLDEVSFHMSGTEAVMQAAPAAASSSFSTRSSTTTSRTRTSFSSGTASSRPSRRCGATGGGGPPPG